MSVIYREYVQYAQFNDNINPFNCAQCFSSFLLYIESNSVTIGDESFE